MVREAYQAFSAITIPTRSCSIKLAPVVKYAKMSGKGVEKSEKRREGEGDREWHDQKHQSAHHNFAFNSALSRS